LKFVRERKQGVPKNMGRLRVRGRGWRGKGGFSSQVKRSIRIGWKKGPNPIRSAMTQIGPSKKGVQLLTRMEISRKSNRSKTRGGGFGLVLRSGDRNGKDGPRRFLTFKEWIGSKIRERRKGNEKRGGGKREVEKKAIFNEAEEGVTLYVCGNLAEGGYEGKRLNGWLADHWVPSTSAGQMAHLKGGRETKRRKGTRYRGHKKVRTRNVELKEADEKIWKKNGGKGRLIPHNAARGKGEKASCLAR